MAKSIRCKNCGSKITKEAKACPKCGVRAKKQTSRFTKLVAFLFVLIIVGVFLGDPGGHTTSGKTATSEVPKTAEEIRNGRIESQFSEQDGSHRTLARFIKRNLDDSGSYAHIETRYEDQNDHILVITSFRAENTSGGFTIETWQGKFNMEGKMLETPVQLD